MTNKVTNMTKSQLVDNVAEDGFTKADAARAVDSVLNRIMEGVKIYNKVTLVGFGTFSAKERPARVGRNPRDGSPVDIAASVVPTFKAGSKFKDAVNE